MSKIVFTLTTEHKEEDIPNNTIHLIVSQDYSGRLQNIPKSVYEMTLLTFNDIFYNNIPNQVRIINIFLMNLSNYKIYLDNLPICLEKIRLNDYSRYTEFEFLAKNIDVYSIEVRRRHFMLNNIKKYITKIPFGCIITNQFDEELVDLLNIMY